MRLAAIRFAVSIKRQWWNDCNWFYL